MIRVHHLNNSRSQRVLWLLEELGVPYEITRYQRNKATMLAPDEMKRVHPLGKSPVIEDEGRTFAETGLIVDRLGILAFPARKFVNSQVKLHLDYLEAELGGGPWFLGERLSAADIMLSFPLEAARVRGGLDRTRPNLFGFVERVHARPAYRRALEKGGPYRFAE